MLMRWPGKTPECVTKTVTETVASINIPGTEKVATGVWHRTLGVPAGEMKEKTKLREAATERGWRCLVRDSGSKELLGAVEVPLSAEGKNQPAAFLAGQEASGTLCAIEIARGYGGDMGQPFEPTFLRVRSAGLTALWLQAENAAGVDDVCIVITGATCIKTDLARPVRAAGSDVELLRLPADALMADVRTFVAPVMDRNS